MLITMQFPVRVVHALGPEMLAVIHDAEVVVVRFSDPVPALYASTVSVDVVPPGSACIGPTECVLSCNCGAAASGAAEKSEAVKARQALKTIETLNETRIKTLLLLGIPLLELLELHARKTCHVATSPGANRTRRM
jgi:hypothetical protein